MQLHQQVENSNPPLPARQIPWFAACCDALCRWDSLPPELLRRVAQHLLKDWLYLLPAKACGSLLPVRATCKAWRAVLDADTTHVGLTVPLQSPEHLADHFPNADSLDLSRYQRSCQEVFPVFQRLTIRWDGVGLVCAHGRR
jgi:hypothetical protein